MPIVSSYFRRAAGAAAGAVGTGRQPTVEVYSSSASTTLLHGWERNKVADLAFGTGLPGGFLSATFSVVKPPRTCPIDTGQKVIIRWGTYIVWWGWVEDVTRKVRGRVEQISVMCLGPYQQCVQRIMQEAIGGMDSDAALKAALLMYTDRISTDYSHIAATGVDLGFTSGTYTTVADTVQAVCNLGNTSNQPMQFAIWEPNTNWLDVAATGNLALNGGFEANSDWTYSSAGRATNVVHNGSYSCEASGTSGSVTSSDYITVAAGEEYILQLSYIYRVILTSRYIDFVPEEVNHDYLDTVNVRWYDSGDNLLSTTTWTHGTHFPVATLNWQKFAVFATSPASAVKAKLYIVIRDREYNLNWDNALELTDEIAGAIDDVSFYISHQSGGTEAKPTPWFWARDLSTFDYLLYTQTGGLDLTETTRALVNGVWVAYNGGTTAQATDATSIAAYRQRDIKLAATNLTATPAAQYRNTYLAQYKDPRFEPGSFTVRRGAIRTENGAVVELPLVRAGTRLQLADGPYAGTIINLKATSWSGGGLQCTPEADLGATQLLAKV